MIVLTVLVVTFSKATFWPLPHNLTQGTSPNRISFCDLNLKISVVPAHLKQLADFYKNNVFNCSKAESSSATTDVNFFIGNSSLIAPTKGTQAYSISLNGTSWNVNCSYYPGLVRAMQTLSQAFYKEKSVWYIDLPLVISDKADLEYRGIMIDSSRHFLSKKYIMSLMDASMYNKINVIHWHITDQDSFPIQIPSIPQIAQAGSFNNKTYSPADISQLATYALKRGIRLIPQIDTPAHTQAWGRSLKPDDFVMLCGNPYFGQFDVTMNKTYEWIDLVLKYVNEKFSDSYLHLGGDEVDTGCWNRRPSVLQFMKANNIPNYEALQSYFRLRQKKNLRQYSNKTLLYWANEGINLPLDPEDIIHWWGFSGNFEKGIGNRTNKVIVSFYNIHYIDIGFGGRTGDSYGSSIQRWQNMYTATYKYPNIKAQVIGSVNTIWGQTTDQFSDSIRIWSRTSALAERLWNLDTFNGTFDHGQVVSRLNDQLTRMRQRGVRLMPITNQLCQKKKIC